MRKFKTCKNKYGYYKIQMYYEPVKFLGFTLRKGIWKDAGFKGNPNTCIKYETREDALKQVKEWNEEDKRNHDSWNCLLCG